MKEKIRQKAKLEVFNEGYNYVCDLMNGIHNYKKIISFLQKLLKVSPESNNKLIELIEREANSINIKSEGMKESLPSAKEIIIQKIEQNKGVLKWLNENKNKYILNSPSKIKPKLNDDSWWNLIHTKVRELAFDKFQSGFYADAVLTCLREINSILKKYAKAQGRRERDGASLITNTFSLSNPLIELADLTTETGRNIQLGYMKIFEGMMIGIRNPKSHENMFPDELKTIHFIFMVSFMMIKLEENKII